MEQIIILKELLREIGKYKFLLLIIIVLNICNLPLKANLTIELDTIASGTVYPIVNADKYPQLKVRMRVSKDGNIISLLPSNIIFTQSNRETKPASVNSADNGWYDVSWYSFSEGTIGVVCTYQDEAGKADGIFKVGMSLKLNIRTITDQETPDLQFDGIPQGMQQSKTVNVVAMAGEHDSSGRETILRVDSIKTYSPDFQCLWRGSVMNRNLPPVGLMPGFNYKVNLTYSPQDNTGYHRDKFKVYYEGGLFEDINLIGGYFNIPEASYLHLIQPNGGERLTPCQTYTIKWERYTPGIKTNIELSTDGGSTWSNIGSSPDSAFNWTVPNFATDNAQIRVSQDLTYTNPILLTKDEIPTYKVAHSFNGLKLLDANLAGIVREWDLINYTMKGEYKIADISYPGRQIIPLGLDYTESDSRFAVAYRYKNQTGDNIAFFDTSNYSPASVVPIDPNFTTKKMLIDHSQRYMAFVPDFGNTILIHSAKDGSFIRKLTFSAPVTAFAFSTGTDEAVVALLNGQVSLITLNDFSISDTFDFSGIPVILEIALSPNGKYIAVGCMAPRSTIFISNRNEVHVYDISTRQIVRTYRETASDPVGLRFNPISTTLVIGSKTQPQLTLWDLPSNNTSSGMTGSNGSLTDISFSPVRASIATSTDSWDHLWIRNFSYPERDGSDSSFTIVRPVLTVNPVNAGNKYVATNNEYDISASFCNSGSIPVFINNSFLKNGVSFRIKDTFQPDSLYPGQCMDMKIIFNPQDTGKVTDSLVYSSCIGNFYVPIEGYGINRNISFYFDTLDFGEVCLNNSSTKEVLFIKNNDPVPVYINGISIPDYPSAFKIITQLKDSILNPGESFSIKFNFTPTAIGTVSQLVEVSHSWLPKFTFRKNFLKGTGIGSEFEINYSDLRFIPEIQDRTIKIKNNSNSDLIINTIDITPPGVFNVTTPLPIVIPVKGETDLSVHWTGETTNDIYMQVEGSPCISKRYVVLGMYEGNSLLSISPVLADPRDSAIIPINFTNSENKPYNGERTFEAIITVNPRMFLPVYASSLYGTAMITKNEIVYDRRIIGVKVDGNFDREGVVAEIHGLAGLAETDTSKIEFDSSSVFWGKAVNTFTEGALFKLINLSGTRRFLQNGLSLISLKPNPTDGFVQIAINSINAGNCSVDVFDELGNKREDTMNEALTVGVNNLSINLPGLNTGTYYMKISRGTSEITVPIMIVK